MNWLQSSLGGWGQPLLLGVGSVLAASVALPVAGAVLRPVAKGAIKGGLYVADSVTGFVTSSQQCVQDVVAEAYMEHYAQ